LEHGTNGRRTIAFVFKISTIKRDKKVEVIKRSEKGDKSLKRITVEKSPGT